MERQTVRGKVVIKASGLAAGKGVLLPETTAEAVEGLKSIMQDRSFGSAGDQVVIEERLEGEECSILAFTDGFSVVPLPASQDHKRALDGDKGLNTGGMGAYAPAPLATPALMTEIKDRVLKPTIDGMRRDGMPFVGLLYAGIMVTATGAKVLEYNCRFGDPETQVVLPLLADDCDLAAIMLACANGCLDSVKVSIKKGYAATVVAAAAGYPEKYAKGTMINIGSLAEDTYVFHAGTELNANGHLETSGGRVLAVTAVAQTLPECLEKAYKGMKQVQFDGMHFRKDIGHRALARLSDTQNGTSSNGGMSYADSGVSIDAGNDLVEKIKSVVKSTRRAGSDAQIGGFGGLFDLTAAGYKSDCVLVAATDGVGTKLKIAQIMNKHDTIGIDLVAMSVNDLIVQGAEPLLFLDYFACGKLDVEVAKAVVSGVAIGCKDSNCALVGGETAEMPGLYAHGDYDLAGFAVGALKPASVLPKEGSMKAGDVVFGLASSGVHSNGFSLVRHVITHLGLDYHHPAPFQPEVKLGEALLTPTRIYVRQLLPAVQSNLIKAMAHITGGGFTDNIPRVLPSNLGVEMDALTWPLLPVFKWLKQAGNITSNELARTFNCGLGMIVVVGESDAAEFERVLNQVGGEKAYRVGKIVQRQKDVPQVLLKNMDKAWN